MEELIGQVLMEGHLEFTCPKCGGETRIRWGDASYRLCRDSELCLHLPFGDGKGLRSNHLHVTCLECDYEWLERPLDAAPALAAAKPFALEAAMKGQRLSPAFHPPGIPRDSGISSPPPAEGETGEDRDP